MPMTVPMTAPGATTVPVASLAGGRYVLLDVLGRGGVATTWRAADRKLGRDVAIKSLAADPDPEVAAAARARFVREARALARFDHPGIVRVYEAFEENGAAHLVMELLEGRSLGAELTVRGRALDADEAEAVVSGVGRALAAVHGAGLLHRDVSPSNIVIVAGRPVLVDFGLARDLVGARTSDLFTRMVTPGFAPPEQYDGDGDCIGPTTDVYGLAATLYHALAGRLPASAVQRGAGVRLEPLRRLRPDVPRVFADAIHDGLELDPAHRPATMPDFLARLGVDGDVRDPGDRRGPVVIDVRADPRHVDGDVRDPGDLRAAGPDAGPAARRWPALVPMLVAAAALGWVVPLPGVALLAFVAAPAVATAGDRLMGTRLVRLPGRFLHHVGAARDAFAPLVVALGGVVFAVLVDRLAPASSVDDVVAGGAGAVSALLVTRPATSGPVADRWVERTVGRRLLGAWVVATVAGAGALALQPDLLPFQG